MLLSCHQNIGQNHDIKIDNRSFENVAQLKYLEMMVTNQNLIQEEIKRRWNSDSACSIYASNMGHTYWSLADIMKVLKLERKG
jgi:hypothetical protein